MSKLPKLFDSYDLIHVRDRIREEAPGSVFECWFSDDEIGHIYSKYQLVEFQQRAYRGVLGDAFLKEIAFINIANEIRNRLKIKDENIAKSITLDTAIHIFSKTKDYFEGTDTLIQSLGGDEAYWRKYSLNYWNENLVATPFFTSDEKKEALSAAKNEISKAESALKELEKSNCLIPQLYNSILKWLDMAKTNIDSGDYGLVLVAEKYASRINDYRVIEARNEILKIQKQEAIENQRKEKLLQEERKHNGLCMICGAKLSFFDKIRGRTSCTKHS